ncbi:MAG: ribbon-helix-helix protein, CopG family [Candidatus Freyarchaeota archaeon]|nr:ribbon-helix-helix protein, CopG family [Candidatus Jordarchaeia archaeon]MBS7280072.1 ribbon-helix-helix protein, CopG family [Candidatus Jordarchaeia archaeon]
MKRFSISLPDDVAKSLEKILESQPTASRSKIIADSLREYIVRHHPFYLSREEDFKGPRVLRELRAAQRRAPSPRRRKLQRVLEGWRRID